MSADQDELRSKWELGMSFEDAAFWYASEHEKVGLRNSGYRSATRMALMRAGLFDKLYAEELLAVGIPVSKVGNAALEVIPSLFFRDSSNDAIKSALSDRGDSFKFAGREWSQVLIIKNTFSTGACFAEKRQRGRPPVGQVLQKIVFSLLLEGKLKNISRKEQENVVRGIARSQHPNLFPKETQPSRQKILDALATCFQKQALTESKKTRKSN